MTRIRARPVGRGGLDRAKGVLFAHVFTSSQRRAGSRDPHRAIRRQPAWRWRPRSGRRCRPSAQPAVLVEEEGTASSFMGLKETIAAQGLFCALYTDRGSHYFYTPKAGEPVDKTRLTQVGRALKQLGIEHIPSYCPEGRGRMERLFGTLQSRLPPLLRQE